MFTNQSIHTSDILPLSEFRANSKDIINKIKQSGRPFLLTQHGKSSVVIMDAERYQNLLDEIELVKGINQGIEQVKRGQYLDNEEFKKEMKEFITNLPDENQEI